MARKTPSNQYHVTNVRDHPILMAADAAKAVVYGFDEQETTVWVVRYAFKTGAELERTRPV